MGKPSSKTTPKTTNNKFWKFCNLADSQKAELFLYGDISETVSYTHLDVYKRQVPCPNCGFYQPFVWDNMVFDKDKWPDGGVQYRLSLIHIFVIMHVLAVLVVIMQVRPVVEQLYNCVVDAGKKIS